MKNYLLCLCNIFVDDVLLYNTCLHFIYTITISSFTSFSLIIFKHFLDCVKQSLKSAYFPPTKIFEKLALCGKTTFLHTPFHNRFVGTPLYRSQTCLVVLALVSLFNHISLSFFPFYTLNNVFVLFFQSRSMVLFMNTCLHGHSFSPSLFLPPASLSLCLFTLSLLWHQLDKNLFPQFGLTLAQSYTLVQLHFDCQTFISIVVQIIVKDIFTFNGKN